MAEPNLFDQKCSKILAEAVQAAKNIHIRAEQRNKWARQFALLREEDGVKKNRITRVLEWYCEHSEDQYTPQARNATEFRQKFLQIEDARKRQLKAEGDDDPEVRVTVKHLPNGLIRKTLHYRDEETGEFDIPDDEDHEGLPADDSDRDEEPEKETPRTQKSANKARLGSYIVLHSNLIRFMGLHNTIFLLGVMARYGSQSVKRPADKGVVYNYNQQRFTEEWGITRDRQLKALEELKKCRLLKESRRRAHNCQVLRINLGAYFAYLYWLEKSRQNLERREAVRWMPLFFDKIQGSKKFRTVVFRELGRVEHRLAEFMTQHKNFPRTIPPEVVQSLTKAWQAINRAW